ncbi:MAG: lysylphosphatidylglycerol synthase domain-containing protein [Candidatus Micrarchaeota archaeon]
MKKMQKSKTKNAPHAPRNKFRNNLFVALNVVLALAVIWFFLTQFDYAAIGSVLSKANPLWIVPAALCYWAMNWISAIRLKRFLKAKARTLEIFFIHMQALLLSDATPGRAGYAYLVVGLRKHGAAPANARVLGVLLASDFFMRALLIIASIALFARSFLWAGVFLAVASAIALLLFWKRVRLVEKALAKIPRFGTRLAAFYETVFVKHLELSELCLSLAASFVGSVLRGAAWLFLFYALGYGGVAVPGATLAAFVVLCALLTSLSFVPLSIAGIGLQEATGAVLFASLLGIAPAAAAALMVLVRGLEFGSDLLFGSREFLKT